MGSFIGAILGVIWTIMYWMVGGVLPLLLLLLICAYITLDMETIMGTLVTATIMGAIMGVTWTIIWWILERGLVSHVPSFIFYEVAILIIYVLAIATNRYACLPFTSSNARNHP